jgi:hypothetical protein
MIGEGDSSYWYIVADITYYSLNGLRIHRVSVIFVNRMNVLPNK